MVMFLFVFTALIVYLFLKEGNGQTSQNSKQTAPEVDRAVNQQIAPSIPSLSMDAAEIASNHPASLEIDRHRRSSSTRKGPVAPDFELHSNQNKGAWTRRQATTSLQCSIKNERFIVLDFETTGLSPAQGARVIEVSAREVKNGEPSEEFCTLVNPQVVVPSNITALTGITQGMIQAAPPSQTVMRELNKFINGSPIVAHNASFDVRFLQAEMVAAKLSDDCTAICTVLLSRRAFPGMQAINLSNCLKF